MSQIRDKKAHRKRITTMNLLNAKSVQLIEPHAFAYRLLSVSLSESLHQYVYNATNVRLRELSFGYTFRNLFGAGKNLTASIIGRNLFFFYKDAPMDPDVAAGTGNGWQGIDMFALPTTRSFGLNLKLNF